MKEPLAESNAEIVARNPLVPSDLGFSDSDIFDAASLHEHRKGDADMNKQEQSHEVSDIDVDCGSSPLGVRENYSAHKPFGMSSHGNVGTSGGLLQPEWLRKLMEVDT